MILLLLVIPVLALSTVDNGNSSSSAKIQKIDLCDTIVSVVDSNTVDKDTVNRESDQAVTFVRSGMVTWYGPGFHGKRTASGQIYNKNGKTAATLSLKLKFGTRVKVTNLNNNKSVIVTINDRGSTKTKYLLDLSEGAFNMIASPKSGGIMAKIEIVK